MNEITKMEDLSQLIYIIRGQKVIFDFDLARLYGVDNFQLKRQVRRNIKRFPSDFMLQLSKEEWNEHMPNWHMFEKYRRIKSPPFAFTEQGVAMLSSILRSERAIEVNIAIMRAFVELRRIMVNYEDLLRQIMNLENNVNEKLFEQDKKINEIFETIKEMVKEDQEENNRKIGFNTDN